jgi:hypothetical protein
VYDPLAKEKSVRDRAVAGARIVSSWGFDPTLIIDAGTAGFERCYRSPSGVTIKALTENVPRRNGHEHTGCRQELIKGGIING